MSFKDVINSANNFVAEKSPEILTALAVTGVLTTALFSSSSTLKAEKILEKEREKKGRDLTKKEIIKYTWKTYLPMVLSAGFSIGCMIAANSENAKRNAALATAYKLSEEAFIIYKDKVIETIGENAEKDIRKIANEEFAEKDNSNIKPNLVNYYIGSSGILYVDYLSGQEFTSTPQIIQTVINKLNSNMVGGGCPYISLSQVYDDLAIKHTDSSDELGWNLYKEGLIEYCDIESPDATTIISPVSGKPAIVFAFTVRPQYNFDKLG